MSKHQKLIEKLLTAKTFKWSELVKLLKGLGFDQIEGDGSRVKFIKSEQIINLHKPHPQSEMKAYAVRQVRESLTEWGEI
jgi:hypothetical protein